MLGQIMDFVGNTALLSNLLFLLGGMIFLSYILLKNSDKNSPLDIMDLLLDSKTNKISINKFGQLLGIFISTWIVVFLVQTPAAYSIFPMIFPAWLAYLGGVFVFNKYLETRKQEPEVEHDNHEYHDAGDKFKKYRDRLKDTE